MVHIGGSGVMYDVLESVVLPRFQHIKIWLIPWEKHEVDGAVVDQSHALDVTRKASKPRQDEADVFLHLRTFSMPVGGEARALNPRRKKITFTSGEVPNEQIGQGRNDTTSSWKWETDDKKTEEVVMLKQREGWSKTCSCLEFGEERVGSFSYGWSGNI